MKAAPLWCGLSHCPHMRRQGRRHATAMQPFSDTELPRKSVCHILRTTILLCCDHRCLQTLAALYNTDTKESQSGPTRLPRLIRKRPRSRPPCTTPRILQAARRGRRSRTNPRRFSTVSPSRSRRRARLHRTRRRRTVRPQTRLQRRSAHPRTARRWIRTPRHSTHLLTAAPLRLNRRSTCRGMASTS